MPHAEAVSRVESFVILHTACVAERSPTMRAAAETPGSHGRAVTCLLRAFGENNVEKGALRYTKT